jgi:hypothetical protein
LAGRKLLEVDGGLDRFGFRRLIWRGGRSPILADHLTPPFDDVAIDIEPVQPNLFLRSMQVIKFVIFVTARRGVSNGVGMKAKKTYLRAIMSELTRKAASNTGMYIQYCASHLQNQKIARVRAPVL